MRKLIVGVLTFSLLISLSACGSSNKEQTNKTTEVANTEATSTEAIKDDMQDETEDAFSFDAHINRIQANATYTYGLSSDGKILASSEPFIDGDNVVKTLPEYQSWTGVKNFSSSSEAIAAVLEDGSVVMCGGLVDEMEYCDFDSVSEWENVVSVAMGKYYIVGLMADGAVKIAGMTTKECPSENDRYTQVEAGCAPMGLKSDGTVDVWSWTWSDPIDDVDSWSDITYVSSTWNHIVALKSDGTVVATGNNEYGQCDVSEWTDIVAVSAGCDFTVGLKADGSVVFCGDDREKTMDFSGWSDIVEIDAGYNHCVGRCSDGRVVSTGQNFQGQLNTDGMNLN